MEATRGHGNLCRWICEADNSTSCPGDMLAGSCRAFTLLDTPNGGFGSRDRSCAACGRRRLGIRQQHGTTQGWYARRCSCLPCSDCNETCTGPRGTAWIALSRACVTAEHEASAEGSTLLDRQFLIELVCTDIPELASSSTTLRSANALSNGATNAFVCSG